MLALFNMKIMKFIALYLICSLIGAGALIIYSFPMYPKTLAGWVSLLVLGLPIILMGEGIGGLITSNRISRSIEPETTDKKFSIKRMVYLFISFAIIFLIVILVGNKLESGFIGEFVTKNFGF